MKVQNNIPLPLNPQPWKTPGTFAVYYDHADHGDQPEGQEGSRYEAEMIVVKDLSEETIAAAKELNREHPEQMQKIIDGIENTNF